MKSLMFLVMFLFLGAFFIISNQNIKMDSSENVGQFFSLYGQWIDGLIRNSGKIGGYVVKMEWLPDR
jgi:hypothetical protein